MTSAPVIYRSLEEAGNGFPRALSIGNFDGVHAGHRRILRRLTELARERGWRAAAMTFDPHPTVVVAPERAPRLLTTPEQRASLMAEEGIEEVLILPFRPRTSHLSPRRFVKEVLVGKLNVRAVLVGANFRFGYRHAGDVQALAALGAEFGLLVEIVPQVVIRGLSISSSRIRVLVESGDVSRAARLLERPYRLEGQVVPGRRVGSTKTVPTLNLETPAEILPAGGVYITRTTDLEDGRVWPSVTNIGFRPTFGVLGFSIETHLLAPLQGPDPRRIRLEFLRRLREERKFPNPESLREQILKDVARSRRYFRLCGRLLYSKGIPV